MGGIGRKGILKLRGDRDPARRKLISSLQSFPCEVCGSSSTSFVVSHGPTKIVQCDECGLRYFNPRPTDSAIADYYAKEAEGNYTRNIRQWQNELRAEMGEVWAQDFAELERRTEAYREKAGGAACRFLDVGCAAGYVLGSARDRGWMAVGIEMSQPVAEQLKSELQLEVFNGTINQYAAAFPDSKF